MKRFTVTLPEDLHAKFKVACTLEGTDMQEVVRKAIEEYVASVEKRKMIPFERE
jgi:metal-responsive CopG/Arc/MetJ family transcriptional regulator